MQYLFMDLKLLFYYHFISSQIWNNHVIYHEKKHKAITVNISRMASATGISFQPSVTVKLFSSTVVSMRKTLKN